MMRRVTLRALRGTSLALSRAVGSVMRGASDVADLLALGALVCDLAAVELGGGEEP